MHELEGQAVLVGIALLRGVRAPLPAQDFQLPQRCAQLLLEAGDAMPAPSTSASALVGRAS
jgi:hypothetical protein